MKNKIIVVFLSSLLIPTYFAFAYDPYYPGSVINPLQIQILPNPGDSAVQRYEQQLRDQQLRLQQRSQENYQNLLLEQQRELQRQLLQQKLDARLPSNIRANNPLTCASGYVRVNDSCLTYNQSCNLQYPNTIFLEYNGDGKRVCDCKSNYEWNSSRTSCVVKPDIPVQTQSSPTMAKLRAEVASLSAQLAALDGTPIVNTDNYTFAELQAETSSLIARITALNIESLNRASAPAKTDNQACNDAYPNSLFTGESSDQGELICDCKTGYQWNQGQTMCISVPKIETGVTATKDNKSIVEMKDL